LSYVLSRNTLRLERKQGQSSLHPYTNGLQSFAILRDQFVRQLNLLCLY